MYKYGMSGDIKSSKQDELKNLENTKVKREREDKKIEQRIVGREQR